MQDLTITNRNILNQGKVKELKNECLKYNNMNEELMVSRCLSLIVSRVNNLFVNELFCLQDIISDIWSILSHGIKRKLGKVFSNMVKNQRISGVEHYSRQNNRTIYIKV